MPWQRAAERAEQLGRGRRERLALAAKVRIERRSADCAVRARWNDGGCAMVRTAAHRLAIPTRTHTLMRMFAPCRGLFGLLLLTGCSTIDQRVDPDAPDQV